MPHPLRQGTSVLKVSSNPKQSVLLLRYISFSPPFFPSIHFQKNISYQAKILFLLIPFLQQTPLPPPTVRCESDIAVWIGDPLSPDNYLRRNLRKIIRCCCWLITLSLWLNSWDILRNPNPNDTALNTNQSINKSQVHCKFMKDL